MNIVIDLFRKLWSTPVVRTLSICAAVGGMLWGALAAHDWKVRQEERVRIATEEASRREDFWRPVAISRKSRMKVAVKKFYELDTVYLAARDSLIKAPGDTSKVVTFINAADSTVKACRALILTCGETVLAQDSLISALEIQNKGLRFSMPGKMSAAKKIALGVVIGFIAGNIVTTSRR